MSYQHLQIRDYVLWIHLGVSAEERMKPQEVRLSLDIEFLEPLPSCTTDEIEGTVCYDTLTHHIRESVQPLHFKTIEFMAQKIFTLTKSQIPQKNKTRIHIHKVHPPMPHILGGSHFIYGDS